MKTAFRLAFAALLALNFSCEPSLEKQVTDLHADSRQVEQQVVPLLQELTQRKNSLSVQGSTLLPEEVEFTGKVATLEETYAQWRKGMSEAEQLKPDQERFDLEKSLLEAIQGFKKQVEALAPKPGM